MKTDMVYFEIDTMCNLNCKHCYNKSGERHDYLEFSDFKKITTFFLQNPKITFILSGGEPLLHPQIDQYLDYLNRLDKRAVEVLIVTNGVLAEQVLTPYLLQENPFILQLSLDGATDETNSYIRGPGHYDKAVAYMKALSQQGYSSGMTRMTINNINFREIEQFFYLSIENEFFPTFSFAVRSGGADENWSELNLPYAERLKSIELIERLFEKNKTVFSHIVDFEKRRHLNIQPSLKCSLSDSSSYVRPLIKVNGDMQPCQRLYDSIYCMGNVVSDKPEKVFCSENVRLNALRQLLINRAIMMKASFCTNCALKSVCDCGCPGRSVDRCGSIMGLDEDCAFRMQQYIRSNLAALL